MQRAVPRNVEPQHLTSRITLERGDAFRNETNIDNNKHANHAAYNFAGDISKQPHGCGGDVFLAVPRVRL